MSTPAPAAPIRKKRNFKALQLDVSQPSSPVAEPAPTRLAPAPGGATGGKKRPPPMKLAPKAATNATAATVDQDNALLTVGGPNSAPPTGSMSTHRSTYHSTLSSTLANLDNNSENKFHDLHNEDLKDLHELGQGNGGSVKKVEHTPTGTIMAKKAGLYRCFPSRDRPAQTSLISLDCAHRCQAFCQKTNSTRVTNHARLQFTIHHLLLRCLYLRPQYLYLHGVHGQGVAGRHLQEDWTN